MRTTSILLSLGLLSSAAFAKPLAKRDGGCQGSTSGCGSLSGIGQISDGQVRSNGSNLPVPELTIFLNNGKITDQNQRICYIVDTTGQFQCNAPPINNGQQSGFSICNGHLAYNGSDSFYQCETGDNGNNIYIKQGGTGCSPITISVGSSSACPTSSATSAASCPPAQTVTKVQTAPAQTVTAPAQTITKVQTAAAPPAQTITNVQTAPAPPAMTITQVQTAPAPPAQTVTKVQTAPAPPAMTITVVKSAAAPPAQTVKETVTVQPSCPAPVTVIKTQSASTVTVTQSSTTSSASICVQSTTYPNLLIPVNSQQANKVYGTGYNVTCDSNSETLVTFNVNQNATGQCQLNFMLPEHPGSDTPNPFTYSATDNGKIDVYSLNSAPNKDTTNYSNKPARGDKVATFTLVKGQTNYGYTFTCPAGQTVSYDLVAQQGTSVQIFEDYNPPAIGVVINQCP